MDVDTVIVTGVTASGCIGNSLVLLAWTTLFDFAAELYGRHRGGGVLKLEIGEAAQLPVVDETGGGASVAPCPTAAHARVRRVAGVLFPLVRSRGSASDAARLEAGR